MELVCSLCGCQDIIQSKQFVICNHRNVEAQESNLMIVLTCSNKGCNFSVGGDSLDKSRELFMSRAGRNIHDIFFSNVEKEMSVLPVGANKIFPLLVTHFTDAVLAGLKARGFNVTVSPDGLKIRVRKLPMIKQGD